MEEIISKKITQELLQVPGEVRGVAIRDHMGFTLKEKGKEGLEALEKMLAELGYPVKYNEVQSLGFFPLGLEAVVLLSMKKLFDFNDGMIEAVGAFGAKSSFVLKVFLRYLASMRTVADQAPKIWRKYYNVGDLKVEELNEREQYARVTIKNFNLHPIHCLHLKGYFSSIVGMVVKAEVTCEEIKCPVRGDGHHEFLVKW